MSMELFRRKQKIVFWIVTLIVVPSFVLVWGVDRNTFLSTPNPIVMKIGSEEVSASEYKNFRLRLQAALGEIPIIITGIPGNGFDQLWNYAVAYSILQYASKAEIDVAEKQIGTYLRYQHPVLATKNYNNNEDFSKAVDQYCTRYQLSRYDFLLGVRDWLVISNYITADNNSYTATNDLAYISYATEKSEFVIKRLRISETNELAIQAKEEFNQKPIEEITKLIREYVPTQAKNPKYREPAKWKFEYVLSPFNTAIQAENITEKDIDDQYNENKDILYQGKNLNDIKDQVKLDALNSLREKQALRNLRVDVDNLLNKFNKEGYVVKLDDLEKQPVFIKSGIKTGISADEPLTVSDLEKLSLVGKNSNIFEFFDYIDNLPEEEKSSFVTDLKTSFDKENIPFTGKDGVFRIRLVEYIPSEPISIENKDGKINEKVLNLAVEDLVTKRVSELVDEKVATTEKDLRNALAESKDLNDINSPIKLMLKNLPEENIKFGQLPEKLADLYRLSIGEILPAENFIDSEKGEQGKEIVVLVDRLIPSRNDFINISNVERMKYLTSYADFRRDNIQYGNAMLGPMFMITLGEYTSVNLWNNILTSNIVVYPQEITSN